MAYDKTAIEKHQYGCRDDALGRECVMVPAEAFFEARETIVRQRQALMFYASDRNYDEQGVIGQGGPPSTAGGFIQEAWFEADYGHIARVALGIEEPMHMPGDDGGKGGNG